MSSKNKKFAIGIDLGGTKLLAALLDKNNRVLSSVKLKTRIEEGKDAFFEKIQESVASVMSEAKVGFEQVVGLGMGCPGVIDHEDGVILSSPNIPFLENMPLGRKLEDLLGLDVVLENDVNTGLYGEHQFGAAEGYKNVAGIFVGTGIGGAFIFDGRLYRGATGAAGEVGHMLIDPLGPVCGCGRRGCLEALAGRLAIASEAAAIAAKQQAPKLFKEVGADILKIKSGVLERAVQGGDRAIEELIVRKARIIGIAMANIVNLLNPDLIVLGGGVVEALPDIIVKEASEAMTELAMPAMSKRVKVVASKLKDLAIVMGAAKLIWDKKENRN